MTIAVALATYNGSQFLKEQLRSLLQQTRKPDHVVISDDGSSDATFCIAERFQRTAPFRVDLLRHRNQQGPMGNFLCAANACDAEYIAFCDQDDVWLPQKLERCEEALRSTGSLAVIHSIRHFRTSDTGMLFTGGVLVPSRVVDGLQIWPSEIAPGMSMVVRKEVLKTASELKALWEPRFDLIAKTRPLSLMDHWSHGHDWYLFTTVRLSGQLTFLKVILAFHRLHTSNYSSGGSKWSQPKEIEQSWGQGRNLGYRMLSSFCEDFADMLEGGSSIPLPDQRRRATLEYYRRWAAIWKHRATLYSPDFRRSVRATCLFKIVGKRGYHGRYDGGLGMLSLCKDILNLGYLRP